jgi:O-antigen ligase
MIAAALTTTTSHERISPGGWYAGIIGTALFLSALPSMRISAAGLSLHPYLILAGLALPWVLSSPDRRLPRALWLSLLLAGAVLFFSGLSGFSTNYMARAQTSIWVKWLSSAITFVVGFGLLRTRKDYVIAVFALVIGVSAMGARSLSSWDSANEYYINVLEGIGSRNSYSLWSTGPFVLALALASSKHVPRAVSLGSIAAAGLICVPQVLSLSRAGWLALGLGAALVLLARRSFRLLFAAALLGAVAVAAVDSYGVVQRLDRRASDLRVSTNSDRLRGRIMSSAVDVLIEHPLLGASQAAVPHELMVRLRLRSLVESHNLVAELVAGTGLLGIFATMLILTHLVRPWWRTLRRVRLHVDARRQLYDAPVGIVVLMLLVRGTTGNDIVYNPAAVLSVAYSVRMVHLLQPWLTQQAATLSQRATVVATGIASRRARSNATLVYPRQPPPGAGRST